MGYSIKENSKDHAKDVSSDGKERGHDRVDVFFEDHRNTVERPALICQESCSFNENVFRSIKGPHEIFNF